MAKRKIDGLEKELFSDRERMELWIAENWKQCVGMAALVVVIVVGVFAWNHFQRRRDAAYRAELAAATPENLDAVVARRPAHPAVVMARLRCARALQAAGQYARARSEYLKAASCAGISEVLRENARMEAATCAELAGEDKIAIADWSAVEAGAENSLPVRAEAGYQAGRMMLKNGDISGAKAAFTRVAGMGDVGRSGAEIWVMQSRHALAAVANGDFAPASK